MMKILLVGGFQYFWYEEVCARSLESMGADVVKFSWSGYFTGLLGRIEYRLMLPVWLTKQFERDLLAAARLHQPDIIWVWRGQPVRPKVVRRLKRETGALLVSYNNDDPFGPDYETNASWLRPNIWKWFILSIKEYDINFVYRPVNVPEYRVCGATYVEVLPPYYISDLHRPITLSDQEKSEYSSDLIFVGHYENDGRVEYLRALVATGYVLRLYGNGWPASAVRQIFGKDMKVLPVLGEEYIKYICGAKLCISFHSRLNRDTYTRRSFEIPACGKVMVSERTSDLQAMFLEGEEAAYFSGVDEMLAVVRDLLANDSKRQAMELSARRRSLLSDFDVDGRMRLWLNTVDNYRRNQEVGGAYAE